MGRIFCRALPLLLSLILAADAWAQPGENPGAAAKNATLDPDELAEFSKQPPAVQRLIRNALDLAGQDLKYQYGSADPQKGGMDCSGTIYYLLRQAGVSDVPRQSDLQYRWVWEKGGFQAVAGASFKSFEFSRLKPGDLLFWTGTYSVERDPAVSHVMIYLGKKKSDGQALMVGASDGRRYEGVARNGVSVFDFVLPKPGGEKSARFVGYAAIPGLAEAYAKKTGQRGPDMAALWAGTFRARALLAESHV